MSSVIKRLVLLGGGRFSPSLYAPSVWLDVTDPSTVFSDDAHTTLAVANTDTVGALRNKGTLGGYATQSSAAARPAYIASGGLRWLAFGIGHFLTLSYTSPPEPVDRISAVRVTGDGDNNYILRPVSGFSGGLYETGDTDFIIYDGGANLAFPLNPTRNVDVVATERHIANASKLAIDNANYVTGDAGSTFSDGLIIGNGRQFRFVGSLMKATFTDPQIARLRTYLAAKQGRVL